MAGGKLDRKKKEVKRSKEEARWRRRISETTERRQRARDIQRESEEGTTQRGRRGERKQKKRRELPSGSSRDEEAE